MVAVMKRKIRVILADDHPVVRDGLAAMVNQQPDMEVVAEAGERAITEEETEIGYYGKSGLLLEDAIREQVLLALPGRTLCREDCQGLCPHCGANRNSTPCQCEESHTDPRWNALAGLAEKASAEHKA